MASQQWRPSRFAWWSLLPLLQPFQEVQKYPDTKCCAFLWPEGRRVTYFLVPFLKVENKNCSSSRHTD